MLPLDLIKTAKKLMGGSSKRPRQSDLKRAISTAYYAVFHMICRECADLLVGGTPSKRSPEAWKQAYRVLEHGFAKSQCKNTTIMRRFPREIEDFAQTFVTLQEKRHSADYDPESRFTKSDARILITRAEQAIKSLRRVATKDRRAFAVWVVMKKRND